MIAAYKCMSHTGWRHARVRHQAQLCSTNCVCVICALYIILNWIHTWNLLPSHLCLKCQLPFYLQIYLKMQLFWEAFIKLELWWHTYWLQISPFYPCKISQSLPPVVSLCRISDCKFFGRDLYFVVISGQCHVHLWRCNNHNNNHK